MISTHSPAHNASTKMVDIFLSVAEQEKWLKSKTTYLRFNPLFSTQHNSIDTDNNSLIFIHSMTVIYTHIKIKVCQ